MVQLVKFHMLSHHNFCQRHNRLVVTIDKGSEKVEGFIFDTWVICDYGEEVWDH